MLGQIHPVSVEGICPAHFQSPNNKVLSISYIGDAPFIRFGSLTGDSGVPTAIGGSEFLVVKVLAEKFRFTPKFRFGEYYSHITTEDGEWLGIVAQVCRELYMVNGYQQSPLLLILISGFKKGKRVRNWTNSR